MSSLLRTLQRKRLRAGVFTTNDDGETIHVKHEPKPQHTYGLPNGGYVTVRYTKGPLAVSAARLAAQSRVAQLQTSVDQGAVIARAIKAAQKNDANEKRLAALALCPVRAITRQMRRHAARKGSALPPVIGAPDKPKRVRKPRAKTVQVAA